MSGLADDVIRVFSNMNGDLLEVAPFPSELEGIIPPVELLSLQTDIRILIASTTFEPRRDPAARSGRSSTEK